MKLYFMWVMNYIIYILSVNYSKAVIQLVPHLRSHFASCKRKYVKIIVSAASFLTSGTLKVSILKYCQLQHSTERNDTNDTLIMQDITKKDTLATTENCLS